MCVKIFVPTQVSEDAGICEQLPAEMRVQTADVQKSVRFLHILTPAHVRAWKT